jgi:hypothetical protein
MPDLNYLSFGGPSSSGEYMVNVAGCDHRNFIPMGKSKRVSELLGTDWDVANRGTRLEIFSRRWFYGYRDDAVVLAAVREVFGNVNCEGDVGSVKFGLPMLQVLDQPDGNAIVKCAILIENDQHYTVKPVEAPYFDPKALADRNARFDNAFWRISKTDGSAEKIDELFDISILDPYVFEKVSHYCQEQWRKSCRS